MIWERTGGFDWLEWSFGVQLLFGRLGYWGVTIYLGPFWAAIGIWRD